MKISPFFVIGNWLKTPTDICGFSCRCSFVLMTLFFRVFWVALTCNHVENVLPQKQCVCVRLSCGRTMFRFLKWMLTKKIDGRVEYMDLPKWRKGFSESDGVLECKGVCMSMCGLSPINVWLITNKVSTITKPKRTGTKFYHYHVFVFLMCNFQEKD